MVSPLLTQGSKEALLCQLFLRFFPAKQLGTGWRVKRLHGVCGHLGLPSTGVSPELSRGESVGTGQK